MRHKTLQSWSLAALAVLSCVRTQAQDSPAVQSCLSEDNDLRRLACYDKAFSRKAAPRPPDQTFGMTAQQVIRQENLPQAEPEMKVAVTAIKDRPHVGLTLTLANQQVWVQSDFEGGYFPVSVGDVVTVTPGPLGSYLLTSSSGGHRSIKVKRVR